jgi:hypothetical protein
MKTQILKITCLGCVLILMCCNNSGGSHSDNTGTKTDSTDTIGNALKKARQDLTDEEIKFKNDEKALIAENNRRIDSLKYKIKNERNKTGNESRKALDELKEENAKLDKNLEELSAESREKWTAFKRNFTKGMDSLSSSLRRAAEQLK